MDKVNVPLSVSTQKEGSYPPVRSFGSARRSKLSGVYENAWRLYAQDSLLGLEEVSTWVNNTTGSKFVEIGCGMGEATLHIALHNPSCAYLAIDVYRPGLAHLMRELHKLSLSNLKLMQGDAMEALEKFPKESLSGFHIFFPDPWPKARHHKRRLMRDEVLNTMVSCLHSGGYIYFVSDWRDYAQQTLEKFSLCSCLRPANIDEGVAINSSLKRPLTRFEKKGLDKGHKIYTLCFVRR